MPAIELWQYLLIALGALLIGLGKGGLSGIGNLAIVLVALALPAKLSVGVLLPIFLSADILAVFIYRRHADWRCIFRLAPWMITGMGLGYFVFSRVGDGTVRTLIGSILLSMSALHLFRKWYRRSKQEQDDRLPHHPAFIIGTGIIGGFATMVANAAGPVAALYFLAAGLQKYAFIGTLAWFFFLANIIKIPLMADLGILRFDSLAFSASFMVYSVLGAVIAPFIVKFINQRLFETLVWTFIIIGGLKLLIS